DDNQTNRTILRRQLATWDITADTAFDGPQALTLLETSLQQGWQYDIVLLDFQMPSMDGIELAQRIRSNPAFAHLKLVLLTSAAQRGDGPRARAAGINVYLTKPVRQAHLAGCLQTAFGQTSATEQPSASLVTRHTLAEAATRSRLPILIAEDNAVNQKLAVR